MTTLTETGTYTIDPTHSTAEFAVKHLMVSTVKGRFRQLGGILHIDEDTPQRSWVEAWIDAASVDTGVDMRDDDLRSENFLGAAAFPRLFFKSASVESLEGDTWRVRGDLTIRGVTRPVVLETEFEGRGPDFEGKERIGFTAQTTLSRRDFGLTYNPVLETGGVVVGDNIKVTLHIEAQREDSHVHIKREST
jgi:polyisoprenoid-binding protein YceI